MEIEFYMDLALRKAWENQLLALPNPSVGALILDENGQILALEAHCQSGAPHAELCAIKSAYIALQGKNCEILRKISDAGQIYEFLQKNHGGIFENKSIFVTLEPCNHFGKTPPCAEILQILRFRNVFISARERGGNARGGAQNLIKNGIFVQSGILEARGENLLYPFLRLRENGALRVFKVAQRLNGSFKQGIISCEQSRALSHRLRNIANRIIISARTILEDNPLLDARLASGRAPNVCVFGRENLEKCQNKNLNMWSVKGREITFHSDIESIPQDGFSIIEGGAECFGLFRDKIDLALVFIAPQIAQGRSFQADFKGEILHAMQIDKDIALWIKPAR